MPQVSEEVAEDEIQSNLSQSSAVADEEIPSIIFQTSATAEGINQYASTSKRFRTSTQDECGEDSMFTLNPVRVAEELLKIMKDLYPEYTKVDASTNGKESIIANELYKKFVKIVSTSVFHEDNVVDEDKEFEEIADDTVDWVDGDGSMISNKELERQYGTTELAEKIRIIAIVDANPRWSMKTLHKNGCAALKYPFYKERWRSQIAEGGSRFDKLKFIDSYVYSKFMEARKQFRPIHDMDLRMFAAEKARSFPPTPGFIFAAGRTWVSCFKRRHHITSRKVTKLVSQKEITGQEELTRRAHLYRSIMKDALKLYSPDYVINSDQTGCHYELTSSRTLSFQGEKCTMLFARSPKNKATHSYTVQFTISASGKLIGPAFLCLQEKNGRLGPRVEENLFKANNVIVTCTSSGKMTSSIVEYYLDKCIMPWAKSHNTDFLFTFDNYSGQTSEELYSSRFTGTGDVPACKIINVPAKCTSVCQPLDTTFNRQFKYLLRRVDEFASLTRADEGHEPLYSRNCIIRRLSLVYYQLASPKLKPMVKYSWYSAGIVDDKEEFLNIREACFSFNRKGIVYCELDDCIELGFIQCAQCETCLCFKCWFWDYHSPGNGCNFSQE